MVLHKTGQGAIESAAPTARVMLGQGATEYLIMLAAILIIALVALALLGFFPGLSSDAKVSQSASYWRSEAKPIAILEHSVGSASGNLTLILQNVDASGTVRITGINVSNATYNSSTIKIGPGEIRTVIIGGVETDAAGTIYDFPINISYISPYGIPSKQYGLKSIVGKYV